MTRYTDASLKAAFATRLTKLAWLVTITREDGTSISMTSHDKDLVVDSVTYKADAGFILGTLTAGINEIISSGEIEINFSDTSDFQPADVLADLYENARVQIRVCDWSNVGLGGELFQAGYIETFEATDRNAIRFYIKGLLHKGRQLQTDIYTPVCRADLGDARCRLPLYPSTNLTDVQRSTAYAVGDYVWKSQSGAYDNRVYQCSVAGTTSASDVTYSRTVTDTITDGTAEFKCEESWGREATVASVTDQFNFAITVTESRAVDGWFALGVIVWLTGDNAGRFDQVSTWTQSGGVIKLAREARSTIQVGDTCIILPGCDKRRETCATKFKNFRLPGAFFDPTATAVNSTNGLNFVGEPDAVQPGDVGTAYEGFI